MDRTAPRLAQAVETLNRNLTSPDGELAKLNRNLERLLAHLGVPDDTEDESQEGDENDG